LGSVVLADEHKERKHSKEHHGEEAMEDALPVPEDGLYLSTCGACHMAYPPGLLNGESWSALVRGAGDHFGENLGLDEVDTQALETYLVAGAAENTPGELARDIARDLGSQIVTRITDVPEIRDEHHELSEAVLARPAIGGLANCAACHTRALDGVFDDDTVRIPRD
jgi:mono/diheme cytochrome c family protein